MCHNVYIVTSAVARPPAFPLSCVDECVRVIRGRHGLTVRYVKTGLSLGDFHVTCASFLKGRGVNTHLSCLPTQVPSSV